MGPHEPRLRMAGGVDNAVDQVKRRHEFEAAHPDWVIWVDGYTHWHGERDRENGSDTIVRYTLRDLLDALEELAAREAR